MQRKSGTSLFIKRLLKNPRQLGALVPSSPYLGRMMAKHVDPCERTPILELGGGTGALTQAMIDAGVDPSRIYVVELDPKLCEYLQEKFPKTHVIAGDASQLDKILPKEIHGRIGTTVSGLPLLNIPEDTCDKIVNGAFAVMKEGGYMLQYTYSPKSSLNTAGFGLKRERLGAVFLNIPPATVWKYTKNTQ